MWSKMPNSIGATTAVSRRPRRQRRGREPPRSCRTSAPALGQRSATPRFNAGIAARRAHLRVVRGELGLQAPGILVAAVAIARASATHASGWRLASASTAPAESSRSASRMSDAVPVKSANGAPAVRAATVYSRWRSDDFVESLRPARPSPIRRSSSAGSRSRWVCDGIV